MPETRVDTSAEDRMQTPGAKRFTTTVQLFGVRRSRRGDHSHPIADRQEWEIPTVRCAGVGHTGEFPLRLRQPTDAKEPSTIGGNQVTAR